MDELCGRTAVVTGGASGIGLATARRLASAGMNIVLGDIEEPILEEIVSQFEADGVPTLGVRTDVADRESVDALAAATVERFGAVHVLINNAGVGLGGPLLSDDHDFYERFEWTMGVNLMGVLHGIRAFVPQMRAHGEPCHVVNTASMAGLLPAQMGAYTISKYGVVAMSEILVQEMADTNVGVSVLCPMFVQTGIDGSERNLPEDLVRFDEPTAEDEIRREIYRELVAGGIEPSVVADHVHDALLSGRFWIFTDESSADYAVQRAEHISASTAGLLDVD